jgi:hypothetical protein
MTAHELSAVCDLMGVAPSLRLLMTKSSLCLPGRTHFSSSTTCTHQQQQYTQCIIVRNLGFAPSRVSLQLQHVQACAKLRGHKVRMIREIPLSPCARCPVLKNHNDKCMRLILYTSQS